MAAPGISILKNGGLHPAATMMTVCIAVIAASCRDASLPVEARGGGPVFAAVGPAVQRPISDFVSAQSTFVSAPGAPVTYCLPNGGGCAVGFFSPSQNRATLVDYAGLADAWIRRASGGSVSLGTRFSGSVTERPLADGRAEVSVVLLTDNALTWVVDGLDLADGTLLFGNRPADVLGGATAALGSAHLLLKFINSAPGAPLPNIPQLAFFPEPGQEVLQVGFRANIPGPLRAAFGVPEGTPGRMTVTQTGLFMTGFHGAVADGFPAEYVNLKVVGR
jgi:hypothetical protein